MFEIHFGSPQNGPISLKYKPDGAGSLFAKLFGVAVVQEHQLIISPSSLEGISDENLLILPGNYFKARFMSQVARPTSYEEVRMQVENVEKIWVYHNPGMELLAVSTSIWALTREDLSLSFLQSETKTSLLSYRD